MLHSGQSATLSSNSESQLGHITKKLLSNTHTADDQKDLEEENYPSDSAAEQDKVDEEQLVKELPSDVTASSTVDVDEKESVLSSAESSLDPLDEEALVNSASFAAELSSAMDHVASIAKDHRAEMISSIVSDLSLSTGLEVTDEMVSSAMRTFAVEDMDIADGSTSEEEEEEEVDESLLAKEMAEALEAVRELAEDHQPAFVSRICDLYGELNDEEPSTMELHGLFSGIRRSLAEEAWSHSFGDGICTESEFEECVDAETLSEEMELALVQVRKQAQLDQEELVDFIMDCYRGLNGSDPSVEAISDILGRIKEQLAEEEREEFIELNQDGDDDEDSDYEEDADSDAEQYAEDEAADIYIESEHGVDVEAESESESQFRSEVEVDGEYVLECDEASEYWADVQDEEDMDLWVDIDSASTWNSEEIESTEDEEELVDSALFAAEWCSAMEHIQNLAKLDQQRIVSSVMASCSGSGSASSSMVFDAMDSVKAAVLEYESEDSVEGEEEVAVEMASALHSVRELGAVHSEQIANRFADLYREENGEEASLSDLYAMFGHVQDCFAEEALSSDLDQETATEHPEQFAVEWASAMDHVGEIAKWHREELVVRLSAIYEEDMLRAPTVGALAEMLEVVQQHFADEAMDELLEDDLVISSRFDDEGRAQNEDSDYCPESDAADHDEYAFDDLDDALYRDSESDFEAEDGTESDSDYLAEKDAVDLESLYADDAEDDLAASSESEEEEEGEECQETVDDDELKAAELGSDSAIDVDSEYSPDGDAFDYFRDYEEEHAATTTATEEDGHSDIDSDSDRHSDCHSIDASDDAVDYNPDFDQFDYSADRELFRCDEDDDVTDSAFESSLRALSQTETESESDDDDDYVVEQDTFDYSQDDIEQSGEEETDDQESGSEQEA